MNRTAAAIAVIILISIVIKCSSKTVVDSNSKPFELELEGESGAIHHRARLRVGGV